MSVFIAQVTDSVDLPLCWLMFSLFRVCVCVCVAVVVVVVVGYRGVPFGIILHLHHNALVNSGLYFCIT